MRSRPSKFHGYDKLTPFVDVFIKNPLANMTVLSIGSTMRTAALVVSFFVVQSALFADTAYQAIRTVQASTGDAILERVVEVRGQGGAPQPEVWHVVLDDPLARGGVRVMEVKGNKIVGERTPVSGYLSEGASSLIRLDDLNLDSSGAFSVVEKSAVNQRVGFDKVDYSLRLDAPGGTPVWFVTLYDIEGREVGSVQIAAKEGAVLNEQWFANVPTGNDREYVQDVGEETQEKSGAGKVIDSVGNFGQRVKRHFMRDGAAVQRFFTGRSTLDDEDR